MGAIPAARRAPLLLVVLLALPWSSAGAGETWPPEIHIDPNDAKIALRVEEDRHGRNLKRAGYALFAAGALYDLYTTKRGLDAGLREVNPTISHAGSPGDELAMGVAVKIGVFFLLEGLTRKQSDRTKGISFLTFGVLQLGVGISNRMVTLHAREQSAARASKAATFSGVP